MLILLIGTLAKAQNNPAEWAHLFQGGSNTNIAHVVSDGDYLYINGSYNGSSTTFLGQSLPTANGINIVMAKTDLEGELVWLNTITGSGGETFFDFQLDNSGNLIATGWTGAQDDIILNENQVLFEGDGLMTNKGMVVKFSAATGSLEWVKIWTSDVYKTANPIRLTTDTSDNIYVAGYYTSDFQIDDFEFSFNKTMGEDVFLIKLDSNGDMVWGDTIETVIDAGFSRTKSLTVNATGVYHLFEYNNTLNINNTTVSHFGSGYSVCIAKYDLTTGNVVDFTTYGSSSGWQSGNHIISDQNNNLFITGHFTNDSNFEIGNEILVGYGGEDAYIAKMSSDLELDWIKTIGGTGSDRGFNLFLRKNGEISLGGSFQNSVALNYDNNEIIEAPVDSYVSINAFQLLLDTEGNYLDNLILKAMGEETTISNNSTIVFDNGNVFTAGRFAGSTTFLGWTESSDHNKGFIMKWTGSFSQIIDSVEIATLDDVAAEIVGIGNTLQLVAIVNPEGLNQEVIWTVEEGEEYASVNENGLVSALAEGMVTVRATSVEDITKFGEIDIIITLSMSTGVLNNENIKLYPNPFTDIINIEIPSGEIFNIAVYDVLGKLVYSTTINEATALKFDSLDSGIYIMNLKGELTSQSIKIIKK